MNVCAATALVLHLASHHSHDGLNNANAGIGLACTRGVAVISTGWYHNSYRRGSAYAMVGLEHRLGSSPVSVGAHIGLASGYATHANLGAAKVIGGATVSYRVGRWEASVAYVPPLPHMETSAMAHLLLRRYF